MYNSKQKRSRMTAPLQSYAKSYVASLPRQDYNTEMELDNMSTNYLVEDLPKILSYEIGDDIDMRRVKLGLHRLDITPRGGEITRGQYMALYDYFYDRRTISTAVAVDIIFLAGREKVFQLLHKEHNWISQIRQSIVHMNVRQYNVLSEYMRELGRLERQ